MRILPYAKHWEKLDKPEHTTFRRPRKDADRGRDWHEGETVCEVVHARASHESGEREIIGPATIVAKKPMNLGLVSDAEAIADGFETWVQMRDWLFKSHKGMTLGTTINKLTLRKVNE